ncbi:hypothetical protein [Candidatus Pyrohabitans sp.]
MIDAGTIIEKLRERNRELEDEIEKNREIITVLEDFASGRITLQEIKRELRDIGARHGDELTSRILEMLEAGE